MTEVEREERRHRTVKVGPTTVPTRSPTATGPHTGTLALQRSVGNRAVAGLAEGRPPMVQRRIATTPSDLDKFISTVDMVKTGLGKGSDRTKSLSAIRDALAEYRSADRKGLTDPQVQAGRLAILDALCTRFLKENPEDKKRRTIVDRLLNEIASERVAVSRAQAQLVYQRDIENSTPESMGLPKGTPGPRKPGWQRTQDADPTKKFAFQALSDAGKAGATNYDVGSDRHRRAGVEEEKKKYGLTDAEIAGITIFSAGDFKYINPATANSQSWLGAQKEQYKSPKGKRGGERFADMTEDRGNRTIMEEGSLHTAMALQGLKKMDPYKGETFRGARFTPEQFKDRFQIGKKTNFTTLTSSSFDKDVGLDFVFGTGSGTKPRKEQTVAVLSVFTDTGGVDISKIAMVKGESEVLILPGSWFAVMSVEEIQPKDVRAKWGRNFDATEPVAKKFYVARFSPAEADPTPPKPVPQFQQATPTGPKLPMSTPWEEYAAKAGTPTRGVIGGRR